MKVGKKIKYQNGAISIEFVFSISFIVMLFMFLIDISLQSIAKSRADKISYSLVTVMKERVRFFDGRNELNNNDFILLGSIAEKLLNDNGVSFYDYALEFESLSEQSEVIRFNKNFPDKKLCRANVPINNLSMLRPKQGEILVPIYQVTLCLKFNGVFTPSLGERYILVSSLLAGR